MKRTAFAFSAAFCTLVLLSSAAFAQDTTDKENEDSDAIFQIGVRNDTIPDLGEYKNIGKGLLLNASQEQNVLQDETIGTEKDDEGKIIVLGYDAVLKLYRAGQFERALPHLEILAKGGHLAAQEILGVMYNLGQGVPKDPKKAYMLLSKPAEEGRPLAQHHIGVMTFRGEGTTQSGVQALAWLQLAVLNYPEGPEKLAAKRDRDAVYARLNRRDRENANIIARDWLDKRGEGHLFDMMQ